MLKSDNIGLYLKNSSNKNYIVEQILRNSFLKDFIDLSEMRGGLYSTITINRFIDEELRHDRFIISTKKNKGLFSMSSGERKRAMLKYLLAQNPEFLVLDDIYSNIDIETQKTIKAELAELVKSIRLIQIFYRKEDILPAIDLVVSVNENNRIFNLQSSKDFLMEDSKSHVDLHRFILPETYTHNTRPDENKLVELHAVSANYGDNAVLENINWVISKNEFWKLAGPNGAGKSTLVSLITGDNPFGYGQNVILFGRKKGSGESIWDIKQKIGYFSPSMVHRFNHNDTVEKMIVSGFKDSVGLYSKASNIQQKIASKWIELLNLENGKKKFLQLSLGQQRMVMVARAMVKHPPLLILDEPTIELDDENSALFVEMVNAIKQKGHTAIIYVSHREEKGLRPDKIFELVSASKGYTGIVR